MSFRKKNNQIQRLVTQVHFAKICEGERKTKGVNVHKIWKKDNTAIFLVPGEEWPQYRIMVFIFPGEEWPQYRIMVKPHLVQIMFQIMIYLLLLQIAGD